MTADLHETMDKALNQSRAEDQRRRSELGHFRCDNSLKVVDAEQRALEDAKADASAVWALADFYLPPDLKEWAASHKIPEFTAHAWRTAFVAGWRAANRFNVGED